MKKRHRAAIVAAVTMAALSVLTACSGAATKAVDRRNTVASARDSSREADPASIGGYERPPYYRIPPNYPFKDGGSAIGEGVDLLPWLVTEPMPRQQRGSGAPMPDKHVLVAEPWFSSSGVFRIDDQRQLVLTLESRGAEKAYVNLHDVGWLFAEAFSKYGAQNVALELTVDAKATLNAVLIGLRPEWYFTQPALEHIVLTHVETIDRGKLRAFIDSTLKKEVAAGEEAEEVTEFLIQVLLRKSMLEELPSTSPSSTFKTYYVTSVFFGLDPSTKALAARIGLSDAQITQIESAMYKRMSGPIVNASGMRGRKGIATVTIPVRKFFDPKFAPENKEEARGWGLVPMGEGRRGDALPARIFLAFGAGLGPDAVPVANRWPDRFSLDEWNLEQRDVNVPGDRATILRMRLVPLKPTR